MKLEFHHLKNDQVTLALSVNGIRFRSPRWAILAESDAPFIRLVSGAAIVSVMEEASQRARWVLVSCDGKATRRHDSLAMALFWQERREGVPQLRETLPPGWRVAPDKTELRRDGNHIRPRLGHDSVLFITKVGIFESLREAFDVVDQPITDRGSYLGYKFHTERRDTNLWCPVLVLPQSKARLFAGLREALPALTPEIQDTGEVRALLPCEESRADARRALVRVIESYLPEHIIGKD